MSELNTKEVNFRLYCPMCKYYETKAEDEPCNGCLTKGFNDEGSHKPVKYIDKMYGFEIKKDEDDGTE